MREEREQISNRKMQQQEADCRRCAEDASKRLFSTIHTLADKPPENKESAWRYPTHLTATPTCLKPYDAPQTKGIRSVSDANISSTHDHPHPVNSGARIMSSTRLLMKILESCRSTGVRVQKQIQATVQKIATDARLLGFSATLPMQNCLQVNMDRAKCSEKHAQ